MQAPVLHAENSCNPDKQLLISYMTLRRAVGIIGFFLPLALLLGKALVSRVLCIAARPYCLDTSFHPLLSISAYYYTCVRGLFVGSLWAIGIFLSTYRGYEQRDRRAGLFACICAMAVSLFPMDGVGSSDPLHLHRVHYVAASLLFVTLAYFSLFLFTESGPGAEPAEITAQKRKRNAIYYVCGCLILAAVLGMLVLHVWLKKDVVGRLPVLFTGETIAVMAFGFSWLVKGEMLLPDSPEEIARTQKLRKERLQRDTP